MKKSILIAAGACLFLTANLSAATADHLPENKEPVAIESIAELSTFCTAIMKGDYDTVHSMIKMGEDVNKKSLGKTPAIYAARYNQADILQLLIDNGANIKTRCDRGYTIKLHAERSGAHDALEVIEKHS